MAQQPSILLIEDEANLRHNLGVLLRGEGYRVVSAEDGAQGIGMLREEAFDLVITDVVMPDVDGFQVMEYLNDYAPDVVVVAMTAYVSSESAIAALRHGAYDYLAKPFDVDLMQIVIRRALERARMQKAFRHYTAELERQVDEGTRNLAEATRNLEQSNEELRALQERVVQMERVCSLGEVTASVSYDLGDSLATIVGFAQVLAKIAPAESGMRPPLEHLGEMAFRCHEIVRNLINLPWDAASEKVQTNLTAVCEEMLARLTHQGDLHRIIVERRLDTRLPSIMADPHQLVQAFTHIALHGCRTMTGNGGEGILTVETKSGDGSIQVVFQVGDLGIPRSQYGGHRDPFFSLRERAGRLGLSLGYGMIKKQGGKVAVHSVPGEGTTYVADFPIHETGPSTVRPPSGELAMVGCQRVLVVDAEEENLILLHEVLHHLGHDADGVSSAQEALQKITDRDYDMVIADMHLLGMDSLHFYQQLRELRPEMAQRVIFITGTLLSGENATWLGQVGCPRIKKPFSVADIDMSIRQALGA